MRRDAGHEILREEPREGYVLRTLRDTDGFEWVAAYTAAGAYIGDPADAARLAALGIAPELASPDRKVFSVGFSAREQKWYGWSHRALYGFGVGSIAQEGDIVTTSGYTADYLAAHPEKNTALPVGFVAKTLADARRMAVAFAEAVG